MRSSPTTQLTFDADDTTTVGTNEAAMIEGTYDGASGTYVCTGSAGCTVTLTRDAKGMVSITAMSDRWVFTPEKGARVQVVDTEYASYGVWLSRTTDSDGALTYKDVDTFVQGTPASNSVASVTGTATYNGSALGVYVHNVLDPAGEIASATGGSFTADATLTATFAQEQNDAGVDTIAASMLNTIAGTIDNFVLAGGESQSWSVELKRSAAYVTDNPADTVTFTGATDGGGAAGNYAGQFFGDTGAGNDATPSTVAGEFTANFLNGSVAGGFGATKTDE